MECFHSLMKMFVLLVVDWQSLLALGRDWLTVPAHKKFVSLALTLGVDGE